MSPKSDEIQAMLREARVPQMAFSVTLADMGCNVLRSAVVDGLWGTKEDLKSIAILPGGADQTRFFLAFARFALEACLRGAPVFFVRYGQILRELQAYASTGQKDGLTPILEKMGGALLCVPEIPSADIAEREKHTLADFLLEHVSLGGGLAMGVPSLAREEAPELLTGEFTAFSSLVPRVLVGKPAARRSRV